MNSRAVVSKQTDLHRDLNKYFERHQKSTYLKPVTMKTEQNLSTIFSKFIEQGYQELWLDLGCGVGESTFHLAAQNPDTLVVGVDRSYTRLQRNNFFKQHAPNNMLLLHDDLIGLLLAFSQQKLIVPNKLFFLYPNPYPKVSQLKKRWYAHAISPFIFNFPGWIEVRTNWKPYALDFQYCGSLYHREAKLSVIHSPVKCITPFERKYEHSGHSLYKLVLKPIKKDFWES